MVKYCSSKEGRNYLEILKRRREWLISRKDDSTRTDLSYIRAEIPALTYAIALITDDLEEG